MYTQLSHPTPPDRNLSFDECQSHVQFIKQSPSPMVDQHMKLHECIMTKTKVAKITFLEITCVILILSGNT
jgi:hypothetical protein